MNNKPVAWMFEKDGAYMCIKHDSRVNYDGGIPLYTHPAKELDEQFKKGFEAGKQEGWKAHKFHHPAKTLTDEEIIKVYENMLGVASARSSAINFARAILKKASEK